MAVERDDVAKLVPIADLKCVGAGGEKCDKPPTHRLVYWDAEDELFCEPHGRMWVEELMPTSLKMHPLCPGGRLVFPVTPRIAAEVQADNELRDAAVARALAELLGTEDN